MSLREQIAHAAADFRTRGKGKKENQSQKSRRKGRLYVGKTKDEVVRKKLRLSILDFERSNEKRLRESSFISYPGAPLRKRRKRNKGRDSVFMREKGGDLLQTWKGPKERLS